MDNRQIDEEQELRAQEALVDPRSQQALDRMSSHGVVAIMHRAPALDALDSFREAAVQEGWTAGWNARCLAPDVAVQGAVAAYDDLEASIRSEVERLKEQAVFFRRNPQVSMVYAEDAAALEALLPRAGTDATGDPETDAAQQIAARIAELEACDLAIIARDEFKAKYEALEEAATAVIYAFEGEWLAEAQKAPLDRLVDLLPTKAERPAGGAGDPPDTFGGSDF